MKVTLVLDDDVYAGLKLKAGARGMGKFISNLVRPHVADKSLDQAYQSMAADEAREVEAKAWLDDFSEDIAPDALR